MRILGHIAVAILVWQVSAAAQGDDAPQPTKQLFSTLTDTASVGMLFPIGILGTVASDGGKLVESLITRQKLTALERWPVAMGWGGIWERRDDGGYIWLRISSPAPLDKKHQRAEVMFMPTREEPIPAALLTHLLAKSASSKISGADTLDIDLGPEPEVPQSKCWHHRTFTIRLTSGAMVAQSYETYCDLPPD